MKKKVNEVELSMDADTLNKVRGKLKPTDKISLTDKPSTAPTAPTTSTLASSVTEDIEPQDQTTIKYLSNVKDDKGEVSKPFTIAGKNYQMIRGVLPSKEVVMAVYCHDDVNESGENMIHSIEDFEKNIANPAKAKAPAELPVTETGGYDHAAAEREYADREDFNAAEKKEEPKKEEKPKTENSLKLAEFKHFVIDTKTGKVRKFKKAEELAKANMTETEKYMNLSQFKKHVDETLFGTKQKKAISEDGDVQNKPDVNTAIQQMVSKMKPYMDKINEPLEKIEFIVTLTKMLQLDSTKFPLLINALKKAGNATFGSKAPESGPTQSTQTSQIGVSESKVITKNDLLKSLTKESVIKTIKVKDIR